MAENLDEDECSKEELRLYAEAKGSVFEFRMLDWYGVPEERAMSRRLQDGQLSDEELVSAFSGPYGHMKEWQARGVKFSMVHVVSIPLTNYMSLEAKHDVQMAAAGASVNFIEKQKFFGLPTPEGIEISDFIMADGSVLLLKYEIDRKLNSYKRTGVLMTESEKVAKYAELAEMVKRNSTPVSEFLEGPRLKLQPTKIEQECDACGNNEAWVVYYGIRIGDEPPLIITKCTECGAASRTGVG